MPGRKCAYYDFCQNRDTDSCRFCKHSPYPLAKDDFFISCKCGSISELCLHVYDADYCYDCDPYDAPCSLYKYRGWL